MIDLLSNFDFQFSSAELRNAILIASGFAMVIAIAENWHRSKMAPPVEWTRKLVHFGGGALCLLIPLKIDSFWIVLTLAIGMCAIFIVSKRTGLLQCIHGVKRSSSGTEFYPIVILLLFVLTKDRYWQYVICVLILAVSDSAAALIGTRFGKYRFTVEDEKKSLEGSIAFFVVTFLVVFIPLLIWQPLADQETATTHYFLAATLLGLLVTCMEVVSLRGTDNLWVPLGSWLVLTKTFQTDVADLIIQNVSFAAILICLLAIGRTSRLINVGGGLVCCLAVYGLWAMGSLDWALVFFIAYSVYLTVAWFVKTPWQIRVSVSVYSLAPPLLVMAAANIFLNNGDLNAYHLLFGPFLAASCVSLGQATANLASWHHRKNQTKRFAIAALAAAVVTTVVIAASLIRQDLTGKIDWVGIEVLLSVSVLTVLVSAKLLPTLPPGDAPKRWLRIRSALSIAAALAILLIQQFGICTGWQPA